MSSAICSQPYILVVWPSYIHAGRLSDEPPLSPFRLLTNLLSCFMKITKNQYQSKYLFNQRRGKKIKWVWLKIACADAMLCYADMTSAIIIYIIFYQWNEPRWTFHDQFIDDSDTKIYTVLSKSRVCQCTSEYKSQAKPERMPYCLTVAELVDCVDSVHYWAFFFIDDRLGELSQWLPEARRHVDIVEAIRVRMSDRFTVESLDHHVLHMITCVG